MASAKILTGFPNSIISCNFIQEMTDSKKTSFVRNYVKEKTEKISQVC